MSKKNKEYLVIGGILLTLIIAYFSVNFLFNKGSVGQQLVEIRYKDEVIQTFDIDVDAQYVIEVERGLMHIEVLDSRYRVHDVDCPDKICEKVGWVKKGSLTTIICLPNNIIFVQV